MTASISLGWISYVVSLSQGGESVPLRTVGDPNVEVGDGNPETTAGNRGMGVFGAMAGGVWGHVETWTTADQLCPAFSR